MNSSEFNLKLEKKTLMVELNEAKKLGKSSPNKILFLLELGKRRMIEPTHCASHKTSQQNPNKLS